MRTSSLAILAGLAALPAYAQQGQLSPQKQTEIASRMKDTGKSARDIMLADLLANIREKYPVNRIVALDAYQSIIVVELPSSELRVVPFDPHTLEIK